MSKALLFVLALTLSAGLAAGNPIIGNWEGTYEGSAGLGSGEARAKIIGLGDDQYRLEFEFDEYEFQLEGTRHRNLAAFHGISGPSGYEHAFTATVSRGVLRGEARGIYQVEFELDRVVEEPPNLGAEPPEDAIVLFDGEDTSAWVRTPEQWSVTDEAMQVSGSNLRTREEFGDHRIHIEYRIPYMSSARGQGRGNSGVYVHGRYEVQVLDSFGSEDIVDVGTTGSNAAIYDIFEPDENASLPPGEWQTYEIEFYAPRFDENGAKEEDARMTVIHNGVTVHDDVSLPRATPGGITMQEGETGPILLQDHGGDRVRYRNIWVEEL